MLQNLYSLALAVFTAVTAIAAFRGAIGETRSEKLIFSLVKSTWLRVLLIAIAFGLFFVGCIFGFELLARWGWNQTSDPFRRVWVVALNASGLIIVFVATSMIAGFWATRWIRNKKEISENHSIPESHETAASAIDEVPAPVPKKVIKRTMISGDSEYGVRERIREHEREGWTQTGPIGQTEKGSFVAPMERAILLYESVSAGASRSLEIDYFAGRSPGNHVITVQAHNMLELSKMIQMHERNGFTVVQAPRQANPGAVGPPVFQATMARQYRS